MDYTRADELKRERSGELSPDGWKWVETILTGDPKMGEVAKAKAILEKIKAQRGSEG